MILRKPWLWLVLAGCSWAHLAVAQTGTGNAGSSPSGNASGTGTLGPDPLNPGATSDTTGTDAKKPAADKEKKPADTTGGAGATKPPARNPFGFDTPLPEEPEKKRPSILTPTPGIGPNGASSTFGTGQQVEPGTEGQPQQSKPKENPLTYTAPGFFGQGQQSYTSGVGRFAKPRYEYGVTLGIGFDDNPLQTPDNTGRDASVIVQTIPAQPEIATFQTERRQTGVRFIGGAFRPVFETVERKVIIRPFQPEQRVETPVPGVPEQPRTSSVVATADLYFNTQWARARSLFRFDLRLGAEYYTDRKTDPLNYNGSLSLLYLRKMSARMQFTANATISHSTQPDYSAINLNTQSRGGGGAYTNANAKFDVSYRWAPRFSTDTSLALQTILYDESGTNSGNSFYEATLGNEFRYIWSPRMTAVADLRYTVSRYFDDPTRDSDTVYVLFGLDQKWSRRLTSSFRLGESIRAFDMGGAKQSSPYGELTVTYQPDARSQIGLNSRYGFEQTQRAGDESVTFRTSLNYSRAFTPRFSGALSLNYVDTQTTSNLLGIETESELETLDGTLALTYKFSRRFSMNARLSYTLNQTNTGFNDFDRTRIFLTGSYDF
jgi:hypothetical protein